MGGALAIAAASVAVTVAFLQQQQHSVEAAAVSSEGDTVQHLFSMPLYHVNVAGRIDVDSIAQLALNSFKKMTADDNLVLDAILEAKLKECRGNVECEEELEDDSMPGENQYTQLSLGDRFFYWQMNHGKHGLPKLKGYDGRGSQQNAALKDLLGFIRNTALPRYLRSLGMAVNAIPRYRIEIWAGVMREQDDHSYHEHFTDGECLASGVAYAMAPQGSGAIQFEDARQPPT